MNLIIVIPKKRYGKKKNETLSRLVRKFTPPA